MDEPRIAPSGWDYEGRIIDKMAEQDAEIERLRALLAELLTCASYTPGHVSEGIVRRAQEAVRAR